MGQEEDGVEDESKWNDVELSVKSDDEKGNRIDSIEQCGFHIFFGKVKYHNDTKQVEKRKDGFEDNNLRNMDKPRQKKCSRFQKKEEREIGVSTDCWVGINRYPIQRQDTDDIV